MNPFSPLRPPLSFLTLNSQTRAFSAFCPISSDAAAFFSHIKLANPRFQRFLSDFIGRLLVNGATKSNVSFGAA